MCESNINPCSYYIQADGSDIPRAVGLAMQPERAVFGTGNGIDNFELPH